MKRTILTACMACAMSISVAQSYGGGSGTVNDPYRISTPAHLLELMDHINQDTTIKDKATFNVLSNHNTYGEHYILTNDIDMKDVIDYAPGGCASIYASFVGHFNGNGYAVKNLFIENIRYNARSIGLFAAATGAVIENVGVENFHFQSGQTSRNAGGIVGEALNIYGWDGITDTNKRVIIRNCYTQGSITGDTKWKMSYSGGILGYGYAKIENCVSYVNITNAGYAVGGIAGQLRHDTILNCTAVLHAVNCSSSTGGIVGQIEKNIPSYIENCFSTGEIIGVSGVGGILGAATYYDMVNIVNCGSNMKLAFNNNGGGITTFANDLINCFFTGSIQCDKGCGALAKTIYSATNCYVAPRELSGSYCTFAYSIVVKDSSVYSPVKHCFYFPAYGADSIGAKSDNHIIDLIGMSKSDMRTSDFVHELNTYANQAIFVRDSIPYLNYGFPLIATTDQFDLSAVHTMNPTDISDSSIHMHALYALRKDTAFNYRSRGIAWKTQNERTWTYDTAFTDDTTIIASNLSPNTTYEYKGYIIRYGDTIYGDVMLVKTNEEDTTYINEEYSTPEITILPNPANSKIYVGGIENAQAEIFNSEGKMLMQFTIINNPTCINITNVPSGIYFMRISYNRQSFIKKLLIKH